MILARFNLVGLARFSAALALAWLVLLTPQTQAAPSFPPLTGRVVDEAHVLSPAIAADLSTKLQALETSTGHQLVVVTVPSLQGYEIEDYGYQLGRNWHIGQKIKNDGVLFIIAPNERKVRVEVGYGLEGVLTDALSNIILQRKVLPQFKAGDMEAGIIGGTDALISQLSADPQTAAEAVKASKEAASRTQRNIDPSAIFFIVLFVLWVLGGVFGRRRGGLGAMLPWIILSGGGGFRGGGFGGGGQDSFGGGGGSFGGGGSSGSW